jgi:hypothetical protein
LGYESGYEMEFARFGISRTMPAKAPQALTRLGRNAIDLAQPTMQSQSVVQ